MTEPEDQLRIMIDQIPTLAWACRPDGTTEFLNQRWLEYTGLSAEEALGWGWKVPVHPHDLEALMETWTELLNSGQQGQHEARLRRFDGEYRWFLFRAVPVRDAQGNVVRWYGTNTDIEDRKQAESLLAAEKRTLEMIARGASLGAVLDDLCDSIDARAPRIISTVLLMDAGGKQLRPAAGARVPRAWADAINPVTIGPCAGSCGTAAFLKERVIASDIANDPLWNGFRDVALSSGLRAAWSQPLITKDGEVLGTFCIYYSEPRVPAPGDLELMERASHVALIAIEGERSRVALTRALNEIQKSEGHLRKIIDTIPTMAWCSGPDGSLEFTSQRWCEYTGLSSEQAQGWGWTAAVHPDDLNGLVDYYVSQLAAGEPGQVEARLRRFDGEYRWFLFLGDPLRDEHGKILKWYGTNIDIEDRKRSEAQSLTLQHELESERDRLRLLLDVQKALVANLDLPNLFTALAASLRRVTDCDLIGLALPDRDSGQLRQHLIDYKESLGAIREGMVVPLHGSASGKAFRTRQLVCLENVQPDRPDPEIYGTPEGEQFYQLLLKEGVPAGYFVPLIRGDEVIAVMQLAKYSLSRKSDVTLKAQEAEFLSALTGQLAAAVANALEHSAVIESRDRLAREQVYLREEIDRSSMFEEIVGSSEELRRVLSQVTKVAPTDATVLILGETGTGKELIARAIHKRSNRSSRAFVRVNCAAIPAPLIASELFGHEKGAFTGATQRRIGRFESADGGTLFLDEIGELPAETQIALLRVLQEREFERVGSGRPISVNVRVLTATNRDLKAAVAAGTFRQDLFYRLNVFPIQMPSLHERADDIPLLVEYFIERYSKRAGKRIRNISKRTLDLFQAYDWPGNIRELQNVVERAVVLCDSETFTVDETWLKREIHETSSSSISLTAAVTGREKEMIEAALTESQGRVSGPNGAAVRLGVPRQTLESKIVSLRIDKFRFKARNG